VLGALLVALVSAPAEAACFFLSGGSVSFGSLDPSNATLQTTFANVQVLCLPAAPITWSFAGNNGAAPSLRMKHATQNDFIPYAIAPSFVSGGLVQNWRLTATILPTDYRTAYVGNFSDVMTVTINP
jgi:spore coat protein U-like protein